MDAITNAMVDGQDPAVAALIRGQQPYCSGTLVAPRVLLTAAHCLDGSLPESIFFGTHPTDGMLLGIVDHRIPSTFEAKGLVDDIGLILLDGDPGVTPATLPNAPLAAFSVGATLKLVGFGLRAGGDFTSLDKRVGTTVVDTLGAKTFSFGSHPSQTCEGDSGGPAFVESSGGEVVVGVTSSGDHACAIMATDTRVDAYVDSFIAPYVAATAAGSTEMGGRCYYDAQCRIGSCVTPIDIPSFRYCSSPCTEDRDCPPALRCMPGGCRYPVPSPGALGSSCTESAQCGENLCASEDGESRACSVQCFPSNASPCPPGFQCERNAQPSPSYACFSKSGGCDITSTAGDGSTTPGLMLGWLTAWMLIRRRRSSAALRARRRR